jgi:hypothetical protein
MKGYADKGEPVYMQKEKEKEEKKKKKKKKSMLRCEEM